MSFINIPRKELERPLVAAGDHPARIHSIKDKESTAKNKMLYILWHLSGTEPPAGQSVLDLITLVPEAYWKLGMLFAAVGYESDEQGFHTEELVGKDCIITVIQDEYEGVPRNKVTAYKKA